MIIIIIIIYDFFWFLTEPGRHNSGKASVLGDATRLLREMISQVESLRRENASLATESRFVSRFRSKNSFDLD